MKPIKKKIVIVIVLLCLLVGLYIVSMKPKDFSKQEGYEQLLENAIIEKNKEIQEEAENSEYFIVPEEMEKNPKYRDSDGSLNPESGDYRFYLFRGSTEPIIIKWIYISRN